jgi:hypothetical protein
VILVGFTHELPEELSATLVDFPHMLANVAGDDTAYWEFLNTWWHSDRDPIVTIEHDIGCTPEGVRDIILCPQPWCAAMYPFEGGEIFGLGLTKFSLALRREVPDALEQVGRIDQTPVHPPKHYCSLDAWLQGVLASAGQSPHVHSVPGGVRHHNPRRSHVACR